MWPFEATGICGEAQANVKVWPLVLECQNIHFCYSGPGVSTACRTEHSAQTASVRKQLNLDACRVAFQELKQDYHNMDTT